eukprot:UN01820
MNYSDVNSSMSMSRGRLPSYSTNSSVNVSSILSLNDLNDPNTNINMNENDKNVQFCWNLIEEIRGNYLYDVENKMNDFKNALSLWNEGGFIPLLSNFMSVVNEANKEINNLSNRLTSNTKFIQRFVVMYKKQQIALKNKRKNMDDVQFENNELKKENEWLRNQLLSVSNTMSTSSQQIKYLNNKHENKQNKFIKSLAKIENMQTDDNVLKIEGVTIFQHNIKKTAKTPINSNRMMRKSNRMRTNKKTPNTIQQQSKSTKAYHRIPKQSDDKIDNSEKQNKPKRIVSRARSFRHSKLRTITPKAKKRRKSVANMRPSSIPFTNKIRSISSPSSAIRKPTATLSRFSSNDS